MIPNRYKFAGAALIAAGSIMTALYFTMDFRFEMPVFAILSSYAETRFMTAFSTNFADELILFTLLAGFILVSFSKERNEEDQLRALRFKALILSVIINSAFLLLSILLIYGGAFVGVLILNIYTPFIIYLISFHVLKSNQRKSERSEGDIPRFHR